MRMQKKSEKEKGRIRNGRMTGAMIGMLLAAAFPAAVNAGDLDEICVNFEQFYTDNGQEYAVLNGADAYGNIVWSYTTEKYPLAQLDAVTEIGARDGKYHFCEGGTIKALDMDSGLLVWENADFGGSVTDWLFDQDGNLYACGYLGPDLIALTPDGDTAMYIGMASEDLYWPYDLEWADLTTVKITYEGGGLDQEADEVLYIDVSDVQNGISEEVDQEYIAAEPLYYVVNCRESITLRTAASVYASELCQMPLGAAVNFLGIAENGFYQVEYNGLVGYALASYLSTEWSTGYSTYWVVNCQQSITLRKVPSVNGAEICQMPLGAAVTWLSEADNGFYCVEYMGQTGYALASYLSADASCGGYAYSSRCQVINCQKSITLRTSPSIYAGEIMQMPLGVYVNYLGFAGNGFYQVEYNGKIGYALASYLRFI